MGCVESRPHKHHHDSSVSPEAVQFAKVLSVLQPYCEYHTRAGIRQLLGLRLVCHAWKTGIDHVLETLPENFLFRDQVSEHLPQQKNLHIAQKCMASPDDLNKFMQDFHMNHLSQKVKNPFVGRRIRLAFPTNKEQFSKYFKVLVKMLHKFGAHVWYCEVVVVTHCQESDLEGGHCSWLKQLLLLQPSLRKLSLLFQHEWMTEGQLEQMTRYWRQHVLPSLPALKMITEKCVPAPVVSALLRANPHVAILETEGLGRCTDLINYESTRLANLQKLGIRFCDKEQFRAFERASFTWPLVSKLSISLQENSFQLKNVVAVVQTKFGNNLTELHVSLGSRIQEQEPNFRMEPLSPLAMPKLQTFHLCTLQYQPLDFLLPTATTLETLSLEVQGGDGGQCVEAEKQIRFFEHRRQPERSNIWELLPRLQTIMYCFNETNFPHGWHQFTRVQREKLSKSY